MKKPATFTVPAPRKEREAYWVGVEAKPPKMLCPPRIDWLSISGWGKPSLELPIVQAVRRSRNIAAVLPFPATIDGLPLTIDRHIGTEGAAITVGGAKVEMFGGKAGESRDFAITITGRNCLSLGHNVIRTAVDLAMRLFPKTVRLAASRIDACADFLPGRPEDVEHWHGTRVARTSPTSYGKPLQTWQEGSRNSGDLMRIYNKTLAYKPGHDDGLWSDYVQAQAPTSHVWRIEAETHTEALERIGCREIGRNTPPEPILAQRLLAAWLTPNDEGHTRLWAAVGHGARLPRQRELCPEWAVLRDLVTEGAGHRAPLAIDTPSPDHALATIAAKCRRLFAVALHHPERDRTKTDLTIMKAVAQIITEDVEHILRNRTAELAEEEAKVVQTLWKQKGQTEQLPTVERHVMGPECRGQCPPGMHVAPEQPVTALTYEDDQAVLLAC